MPPRRPRDLHIGARNPSQRTTTCRANRLKMSVSRTETGKDRHHAQNETIRGIAGSAPAGELLAPERDRSGASRLGDPVVAGEGTTGALAAGGDRFSWRQWILPAADAAVVRSAWRALYRGDREELPSALESGGVARTCGAGLPNHGRATAAVRFGALQGTHVGPGATGDV